MRKVIFFRLVTARELATVACILAETQRQGEEWRSFMVEEREGFSMPCLEALGSGLARRGTSYVISYGYVFGFLWMVLRQK